MEILKPLKEFKSYQNSYTLIDDNHPKRRIKNLFKYMDLETTLKCLKYKNLRFVQPSEWPDRYERHFYDADYSNLTNDSNVTPKLWACCFTTNKISEASWNTYRYGKQGLGNKCVKFQISRSKLRNILRKDKRVQCIYEGFMNYSISDYDIQNLHKKSSPLYKLIFSLPFSVEKYLSLLLIKRSAFNYENEFRFLITTHDNPEEKIIFIHIEWSKLIEKVEIDKDMTDMEIEVLKTYLRIANVPENVITNITPCNLYHDPSGKVKIEI